MYNRGSSEKYSGSSIAMTQLRSSCDTSLLHYPFVEDQATPSCTFIDEAIYGEKLSLKKKSSERKKEKFLLQVTKCKV